MDERETRSAADPKIVVALISGAVSIAVAFIARLNASDRTFFILLLVVLGALALLSAVLLGAVRRRLFGVFVTAAAIIGCIAFVNWQRLFPRAPELAYVPAGVTVLAGTGERAFLDGPAELCAFSAPESVAFVQDALCLTDGGRVRRLSGGTVETMDFPWNQYNALLVRGREADTYVLAQTRREEDGGGKYYNVFLRLRGDGAEVISDPLEVGAFSASVEDFTFSQGGVLWFLHTVDAPGAATATLEKLSYDRDTDSYGSREWVMDLPYGADVMRGARMVFDSDDNLYLSVPGKGLVLRLGRGEQDWRTFAGTEDAAAQNDTGGAAFAYPTSLAARDGYLYVMDNGILRRVTVQEDRAVKCETLAGVPPQTMEDPSVTTHEAGFGDTVPGDQMAFSSSDRAEIAVDPQGRVILTDPLNALVYQIQTEA